MKNPNQEETTRIEVAYAKPDAQKIISLNVTKGTSILEAVKQSSIVNFFPEIDLTKVKLGLFGKPISQPDTQVAKSGDRIEIYRPLIADPKEIRKKRAQAKVDQHKS